MENVIFRKARYEDMEKIMTLITEVFSGEQSIPKDLIPIPEEMSPQWWCAENNGIIVGSVALFWDQGTWHMGRFAVSPEQRGKHLGSRLIKTALRDIFSSGIQEICCEARDTTVHIIKKYGGEVTGKAVPFYEGTVTPMILRLGSYTDADDLLFCKELGKIHD